MFSRSTKTTFNFLLAGGLAALLFTAAPAGFAQEQAKTAVIEQVNINEADAQVIADILVGVGMAKANAIVEFRKEHGPFTSVDQLLEVSGIGASTLANNRQRIALE